MMPPKLVVFDFCDTITNFQTADGFIKFVHQSNPKGFGNRFVKLVKTLIKLRFFVLFNKLFPKKNVIKRCNLWSLRGLKKEQLEAQAKHFFESKIATNYQESILIKLREHVQNQDIVVISSGGYDLYLKYFCQKENIPFLHCTKIAFNKNTCRGRIDGEDCMFEQKVVEIEKLISENQLSYSQKVVYSDSITDMPLFLWADEAYVVSQNKSQDWVSKTSFHEIIIK